MMMKPGYKVAETAVGEMTIDASYGEIREMMEAIKVSKCTRCRIRPPEGGFMSCTQCRVQCRNIARTRTATRKLMGRCYLCTAPWPAPGSCTACKARRKLEYKACK